MMALLSGSHNILKINEMLEFSSRLILRAFLYSEDNSQWRIQSTWSKLDHTDKGGLQK